MKSSNTSKSIAAYVTFKALYDKERNNIFKILSMFIESTIKYHEIKTFDLKIMSEKLKEDYDFDIPLAVIGKALFHIKSVAKKKNRKTYTVDMSAYENTIEAFYREYDNSEQYAVLICSKLEEYIKDNCKDIDELILDSYDISKEYNKYLLDYNRSEELNVIFSKFTLSCQSDPVLADYLENMQAGAIIYSALTCNENERDNKWPNEYVIFLDTEIIFDIYGLNGSEYECQAEDFISLVREINKNNQVIKLRYFSDIEQEIDNFFSYIEKLVREQKEYMADTIAAKMLLEQVESPSDLLEKREDLRHYLQKLSIESYDTSTLFNDNNRKISFKENVIREDLDMQNDFDNFRYIGYINILRDGKSAHNFREAACILVTGTTNALKISNYINSIEKTTPCAITLASATIRLWYELNKNLSKVDIPKSFSILVKAKMCLSVLSNKKIIEQYHKIKSMVASGSKDINVLIDACYKMRDYTILPEEVNEASIERIENALSCTDIEEYKTEVMRVNEKNMLLEREKGDLELFFQDRLLEQQQKNENESKRRDEVNDIKIKQERILSEIAMLNDNLEEQKYKKEQQKNNTKRTGKYIALFLVSAYIIGILTIGLYMLYICACIIVISIILNKLYKRECDLINIINPLYNFLHIHLLKYYSDGYSEKKLESYKTRIEVLETEYYKCENQLKIICAKYE